MINYEVPETVDYAVELMLKYHLLGEDRDYIASIENSDDMIQFHLNIGMFIRNHFGLWTGNKKLINDTGKEHPDDASGVILKEVWNKLRELKSKDIDIWDYYKLDKSN